MPERNGLITTAELAAILDQPDLRLFDGTTYLEYQPAGSDIGNVAAGGLVFEVGRTIEQPEIGLIEDSGEFRGRDKPVALRHVLYLTLIWKFPSNIPVSASRAISLQQPCFGPMWSG